MSKVTPHTNTVRYSLRTISEVQYQSTLSRIGVDGVLYGNPITGNYFNVNSDIHEHSHFVLFTN